MNSLLAIDDYLQTHHVAVMGLITSGAPAQVKLQDACDAVYAMTLLGRAAELTAAGADAFVALLRGYKLAGDSNHADPEAAPVSVHGSAYALGALLLYEHAGHRRADAVLRPEWNLDEIIEPNGLPRWPKRWSHHSWRVSHWIGGAPSILCSLARLAPEAYQRNTALTLDDALSAADTLIDPRSGTLRCYRSDLLQAAFRAAYRVRHDPEVGDVGGIVHLHWVNHARDRKPYKAREALLQRALKLYERRPFIESVPYCLDFDVVQIVRTAASEEELTAPAVRQRAEDFIADIDRFWTARPAADYTIHKLPGALATQHEAALILGANQVGTLGVAPIDIIKQAHWI